MKPPPRVSCQIKFIAPTEGRVIGWLGYHELTPFLNDGGLAVGMRSVCTVPFPKEKEPPSLRVPSMKPSRFLLTRFGTWKNPKHFLVGCSKKIFFFFINFPPLHVHAKTA